MYLVLDNEVANISDTRSFHPYFPSGSLHVHRVPSQSLPTDLSAYRGILLSGSTASWANPEPWMAPLVAFVQRALKADIPMIGCCFGHQLLAVAAAGPSAVLSLSPPEVGYLSVDQRGADPLLSALPPSFPAFISHEDAVIPRDGFQILASSERCEVQALRVTDRRAWGVQFHVEYSPEEERTVLRYRARRHPDLSLDVESLLSKRVASRSLARPLFARFQQVAHQ